MLSFYELSKPLQLLTTLLLLNKLKNQDVFFCDCTTHCLGLQFYPEVKECLNEGLVAYTPLGRLAWPDGSELPHTFGSQGGVTKILQEEHTASSHLKELFTLLYLFLPDSYWTPRILPD